MIVLQQVKVALKEEDIEDLIGSGAPADEYDSEAEEIHETIQKLPADQRTENTIAAIIGLIFAKAFHRSSQEMETRMPAVIRIANKLMQYK